MVRVQLSEEQWSKVDAFLVSERGAGRPGNDDRKLVEAVLWWRRRGVPWRDLPTDFGPWKTVFNRFDRWAKTGKWQRLFLSLQTDRDDEWHSVDSTINRAHQHASGGQGAAAQGIGRSRGGLSTQGLMQHSWSADARAQGGLRRQFGAEPTNLPFWANSLFRFAPSSDQIQDA
jgi:transposase